jgi:hypothetical protein
MRRRCRPETKAVDEACLGGRMEIGEHGAQAGEVRAMKAVEVDRPHRHDPNADRRRARADGLEERLALGHRYLLRVVQRREAPDPRAAERSIVEEDTGDDERPGKRAPTGLVGTRHEAHIELAIEPEESLAAGSSHAAENRR